MYIFEARLPHFRRTVCKSVKVTTVATIARKKEAAVKEIYKRFVYLNFRKEPHGYDGQLRKKQ